MQLQSYVPADVDVALELASLAINLKPNSDNISPYTLNYGLMEPRNQNFLPEIRTSNPSVYQGAIADRISFFRELIRNHFTNDPPPAANPVDQVDPVDKPGKPGESLAVRLALTSLMPYQYV